MPRLPLVNAGAEAIEKDQFWTRDNFWVGFFFIGNAVPELHAKLSRIYGLDGKFMAVPKLSLRSTKRFRLRSDICYYIWYNYTILHPSKVESFAQKKKHESSTQIRLENYPSLDILRIKVVSGFSRITVKISPQNLIIHPAQQHGAYTLGAAFLGCLRLDFTFGRLGVILMVT
jgi:hypothetical protein